VRHGSTELNADDPHKDKIRGFINVPLSNEGKKEAASTADELKDSGIKTIITSDLTRARQTADAIAKTTGAKVVEDPGLRPWHFGPTIEGKPTDKMLPVIQSYVDAPDKRPRGGETFNEFKDRYLAAFHNAQDNYPDENTALVTHFRGLQLMKAWRETGVDNDTVDPRVFTEYSPDEKPASYDVVDKTGAEIAPGSAQFQAPREKNQTKTNETAYLKDRNDTHGWWLSPAGDLIRLKTGEHATDAFEHLGEKPSREAKTDAYHAESINAYHRLVSRGWRAVLPQTFWRQGQDFPTLIFRGGEISDKAPSNLNPTQRAAMERLAIKHDLTLQNNLGHTLYAPPARPEETSAPIEATPEQPRLTPAQVIAEREAQWEKQGYKRDPETGNFTSGQFQPPFQDPNFDEKLKEIRSGKSGGTTFNADGTEWSSKNRDEHLGSLFSVNLPLGDLNRENVENAIRKHFPLLDEPNIKAGIFAFSKDGKPTASVDLNAVISNKHIENTKRFAKQNDQVSIWDTSKGEYGEEVPTGGKGNTRLQTTDELLDALNSLTQGMPTDVDDIIKENRVEGAPERTESLPGIPTREETLTPAQAARLSNAEIAKYYPESVKAKTMPRNAKGEKVHEAIPSRITESPLYKAAGGGEAAEQAFGRKLAEFAREYQDHPSYQSGLKWYSEFVPMLKKAFGKYHPIMAELLAGTSPNETPDNNFAMAVDALEGYKSGRFDKQIAKFEEGLDMLKSDAWKEWAAKNKKGDLSEAGFLKEWVDKYDLKPRKANGKLYGISSDAVMKILARKWLENTPGLKTQNFVKNLLGIGHEATIDLWADRTMRRLGYAGFRNRWRILPKNGDRVSDADFLFSQAAFRHAAKELGLTPDALQGGLWFAEKQLWADRGYGKLDLGDFREEIKKLGMLKEGVKQSLAAQKKAAKAGAEEQPDLLVTPRNLKK
jgi:probable phosphoglycerate mutase